MGLSLGCLQLFFCFSFLLFSLDGNNFSKARVRISVWSISHLMSCNAFIGVDRITYFCFSATSIKEKKTGKTKTLFFVLKRHAKIFCVMFSEKVRKNIFFFLEEFFSSFLHHLQFLSFYWHLKNSISLQSLSSAVWS